MADTVLGRPMGWFDVPALVTIREGLKLHRATDRDARSVLDRWRRSTASTVLTTSLHPYGTVESMNHTVQYRTWLHSYFSDDEPRLERWKRPRMRISALLLRPSSPSASVNQECRSENTDLHMGDVLSSGSTLINQAILSRIHLEIDPTRQAHGASIFPNATVGEMVQYWVQ